MFADMAVAKTGTAEVLFLIGAILAGLAALFAMVAYTTPPKPDIARWAPAMLSAAVCLYGIAWLIL